MYDVASPYQEAESPLSALTVGLAYDLHRAPSAHVLPTDTEEVFNVQGQCVAAAACRPADSATDVLQVDENTAHY